MKWVIGMIMLGAPLVVPADNGFSFQRSVDAMTDQVQCEAIVTNEGGHRLRFYLANGAIWASFRLAESSDVLGDPPPSFRVDKGKIHNLSVQQTINQLVVRLNSLLDFDDRHPLVFNAEPKWVQWRVGTAENENPSPGIEVAIGQAERDLLAEIRAGKSILFRYRLFTGGTKDTSFSLAGASAAIDQLVDCALSVQ